MPPKLFAFADEERIRCDHRRTGLQLSQSFEYFGEVVLGAGRFSTSRFLPSIQPFSRNPLSHAA